MTLLANNLDTANPGTNISVKKTTECSIYLWNHKNWRNAHKLSVNPIKVSLSAGNIENKIKILWNAIPKHVNTWDRNRAYTFTNDDMVKPHHH